MMRGLMEQQKTCEFYAEHIGKFDPRSLLALLHIARTRQKVSFGQ
jgi:hypothetical protein